MRVLVAPQEFKGSLAADEAAMAIASGLRAAHPDWSFDILPLSDGGPGLLDALRRAVKADTMAAIVRDALGRKVLARYLRVRSSGDIIIEAAQANGVLHVKPHEYDPLGADTFGVGELLLDAAQQSPPRIIIGVGGSVTNDGGEGMARALGATFLDMAGRELPPGGGALGDLEQVTWQPPALLEGIEIVVATDVTNPLCGPNGAARIYGPQKGATPEQVDQLEAAYFRYAQVLRLHFGVDIASLPGGGAAGGLAAGLVAFLGAHIASGFEMVAEATNLRARLAAADLVVTGEGSFDSQSQQGKVTGRVLELAAEAGKPAVVFAGRANAAPDVDVVTLASREPDPARCMEQATSILREAAKAWAAGREG
ncbi:MAG: glycerate kinase [Dehalococcoidia bacterium]|nr:glycerate kinase [Dehalococcoidia bacterium]